MNAEANNTHATGSFTLRDLAAIAFRHQRVVLICFFGISLGAVLAIVLTPATYQAKTRVLLRRGRVDPIVTSEQGSDVVFHGEVTEAELNSETELVQSEDVLRKVVIACGLHQQRSWLSSLLGGGDGDENKRIARAVEKLRSKLQVEQVKKSNMISIAYSSPDPRLAAKVLESLDNFYVEKHVAVNHPTGQVQFFEQQALQYRKDLADAEARLKEFASQQGGVAPQVSRDIALQRLSEFAANLYQTQAEMKSSAEKIRA